MKARIWSGDNQTMNHHLWEVIFSGRALVRCMDGCAIDQDDEIFLWISRWISLQMWILNMRFVQSPSLVGGYELFACDTETLNLPSNNSLRLIFSFDSLTQVPRMILNERLTSIWTHFQNYPKENCADMLEDLDMHLMWYQHAFWSYSLCLLHWLYDALQSLGVVGLESRDARGEVEFPLYAPWITKSPESLGQSDVKMKLSKSCIVFVEGCAYLLCLLGKDGRHWRRFHVWLLLPLLRLINRSDVTVFISHLLHLEHSPKRRLMTCLVLRGASVSPTDALELFLRAEIGICIRSSFRSEE